MRSAITEIQDLCGIGEERVWEVPTRLSDFPTRMGEEILLVARFARHSVDNCVRPRSHSAARIAAQKSTPRMQADLERLFGLSIIRG